MKIAIVTGANGFIGNAVCKALLKKSYIVYAIVHKSTDLLPSSSSLKLVLGDISEADRLIQHLPENADVFYHLAWNGSSGKVLGDIDVQMRNIKYSYELLKLAHKIGVKKFIFAGTINELELKNMNNVDVFMPRAASAYGIAKLSSDYFLKVYAANNGINYNTVVIGSTFGPGDKSWRIHNTVIKKLMCGCSPQLINYNILHDWVYIDDVAEMLCEVGEKGVMYKNYYLGHRKLRLFGDIIMEVRDILNSNVNVRFGDIQNNFQIDYSLVDLNALFLDTGYECRSDFKESILKTAEWVRNLI